MTPFLHKAAIAAAITFGLSSTLSAASLADTASAPATAPTNAVSVWDASVQNAPADFVGRDDFRSPKLSPGGQNLAYIRQYEGENAVIIQNLGTAERFLVQNIKNGQAFHAEWASMDRLLVMFEMTKDSKRGGYTAGDTRLVSVTPNGGDMKWLVLGPMVKQKGSNLSRAVGLSAAKIQHDIISLIPDDPKHILLSVDSDEDGMREVRRINVTNGQYREIKGDRQGIEQWIADSSGTIRLALGADGMPVKNAQLFTAKGKAVKGADLGWLNTYHVEGFGPGGDSVYVTHRDGKAGLYTLTLSTGSIAPTAAGTDAADVAGLVKDPATMAPIAVVHGKTATKTDYLNPDLVKVGHMVGKALAGRNNVIVDHARGCRSYVIGSTTAGADPKYFLLNLDKKTLEPLIG